MPRPGSDYLHKKSMHGRLLFCRLRTLDKQTRCHCHSFSGSSCGKATPSPPGICTRPLPPRRGMSVWTGDQERRGARDQLNGGSYPEPRLRSCRPHRPGLSSPTRPSSNPHPVHTTSQTCWKNYLTTKPPNKALTQQAGPWRWRCRPSQLPAPQGDTGRLCGHQEKVGFPKDNGAAGGRLGQLPPAVGSPGPPVCTKAT